MPVLYGEIREEKAGQCKQHEQKGNEYLFGFLVRSYGLTCASKDCGEMFTTVIAIKTILVVKPLKLLSHIIECGQLVE